jgi:glycosyltransferase involved in cell wall biosynthesis
MKYLFVHQNFPGQFLHLVRHLLATGNHDVVFICEQNANFIPGVRRVIYQVTPRAKQAIHVHAREFEQAMARAEAVARAARQVKALGFEPDIIIGHHGWGELLNLGDVWPAAPLLGYHEYYYNIAGHDVGFDPEFPIAEIAFPHIRAKNAVNHLALTNPGFGMTPTRYQLETYPEWARPAITLVPEGVNLDVCKPVAARRATTIANIPIKAAEKLVTFVSRDLEPYRGFHIMMRAIPAVLRERPDARFVLVGGDGVSYGTRPPRGTWRERMTAELGKKLDLARVHFPGKLDYADYVKLLQRSDAHVYLTYPFVASWSLREAMACGCAIVASDTAPVQEFVTDGETGLMIPFHDHKALAAKILQTLEGGAAIKRMRVAARRYAEANLRMDTYLARFEGLIGSLISPPAAVPRAPISKAPVSKAPVMKPPVAQTAGQPRRGQSGGAGSAPDAAAGRKVSTR